MCRSPPSAGPRSIQVVGRSRIHVAGPPDAALRVILSRNVRTSGTRSRPMTGPNSPGGLSCSPSGRPKTAGEQDVQATAEAGGQFQMPINAAQQTIRTFGGLACQQTIGGRFRTGGRAVARSRAAGAPGSSVTRRPAPKAVGASRPGYPARRPTPVGARSGTACWRRRSVARNCSRQAAR